MSLRWGTRDWYLMHYSTHSITGGQKHTHTQPCTVEDARGKPSFCKWRAKIEKGKGTEHLEERTFQYGGYKFVWGDDNQDNKEKRLLNRIITVTNNNFKKGQKRTAGDADAEFGAPMKKRRHLE